MYYDVAIIGAGPSGSSLAALLGLQGLKVVVVDRYSFPRIKHCGGMLTPKTIDLINALFPGLSYTTHSIRTLDIMYKQSTILSFKPRETIATVSRYEFDYELVKYAQRCGVTYLLESKIKSICFSTKKIETTDGNTFHYCVLVGADGVDSLVRHKLGLQRNEKALCIQSYIPYCSDSITKDISKEKAIISFGGVEQGYLWWFPSSNGIVVGAGGKMNSTIGDLEVNNISKTLLQKSFEFNSKKYGAYIPTGNNTELGDFTRNTYLVGDAAGLIDPITGEGLYYAIYSSSILANVLVHFSSHLSFKQYQQRMLKTTQKIKDDYKLREEFYEPQFLAQALHTLGQVPDYACELIHSTVCTYQMTYKSGYDELNDLLR